MKSKRAEVKYGQLITRLNRKATFPWIGKTTTIAATDSSGLERRAWMRKTRSYFSPNTRMRNRQKGGETSERNGPALCVESEGEREGRSN